MNEILLRLAMGQIPHQVMNRKRLDEIVDLTGGGSEADVMNGLDSYIVGAVSPLITALHGDGDLTKLPATMRRIQTISELIMKMGAR